MTFQSIVRYPDFSRIYSGTSYLLICVRGSALMSNYNCFTFAEYHTSVAQPKLRLNKTENIKHLDSGLRYLTV